MARRTGPGEEGVKVCAHFMDNDCCSFTYLTFNYIYLCHKNMIFGSDGGGCCIMAICCKRVLLLIL